MTGACFFSSFILFRIMCIRDFIAIWEVSLVCSAVITSVYNFSLRILGYPSMRASILIFSGPSKTSALAISPYPSPSSGVNEPSV